MPMLGQQALVRVPHTQRTTGSSLHYLLQGPSIQITAKVASLSTYKILCYSFHIEKQQDQRNTHFKTAPPAAAQMVKDLPAVQETQAGSLGREYPREGNGNPLQCSCLENPIDGGAWSATVHGVTKSCTRLSD